MQSLEYFLISKLPKNMRLAESPKSPVFTKVRKLSKLQVAIYGRTGAQKIWFINLAGILEKNLWTIL